MINHSNYQDMLVCQKTTNSFIIIACGLVLLMCDCLFFLTTHVPERFLLFVWVCGLSVKKIKARLYLFNLLGNINFAKKGIHIYMQVGNYYSFFLPGTLKFFCIIYLLYFCPFYRTPSILECFRNFLAHHKLDIKTFLQLKGGHQK